MTQKIIINTDGGAIGNPGPAGIGVIIKDEGKEKKYSEKIGNATNNEAEYKALIFSLKKTKLLFGKKNVKNIELDCYLDSELLVKQLNGEYKIKEKDLQQLFIEVWNLKIDFKNVKFIHVPREQNKEADALVGQAIDKKQSKLI
ncbi:MAG: ribonuclease HI family protein [Candidatus Pacebacteria bacterium]|nr:ribonuclease HI family protein [Candidatus Paceibacterota bacterium]